MADGDAGDGAGGLFVSVGVVFWDGEVGHAPDVVLADRDPDRLERRLARVLHEAMAEQDADPVWAPFLARHGAPPDDREGVAAWLDAARMASVGEPVFHYETAYVTGAGEEGAALHVAAMAGEDVWEGRIFADIDPDRLRSLVADIAWERMVRHGTAPGSRAGVPDRVLADRAARFATADLEPHDAAPTGAAGVGEANAPPAAHPAAPGDGTVLVEMPEVWADLEGSGVGEMVSGMFEPPPRRGDYPPGARGEEKFENDCEIWREEVLELASAAASLPDILDRLDLLERQRGQVAIQIAQEPLPAEPGRDAYRTGPGRDGPVDETAYRWDHRDWADQFIATARRRDALIGRLLEVSRPGPAANMGFRDLGEDQARARVADLAHLIGPSDAAGGRSLAERRLDRAARFEVDRLIAAGDMDVEVEVVGADQPELRFRGPAGDAHHRLGAGWYEAAERRGGPVGLVVGRQPYGDGSMVSAAYPLDASTAMRLAPARRLRAEADHATTAQGPAPATRAGLAPAGAFGRDDRPRHGPARTL
jgi:hypothetical protein